VQVVLHAHAAIMAQSATLNVAHASALEKLLSVSNVEALACIAWE